MRLHELFITERSSMEEVRQEAIHSLTYIFENIIRNIKDGEYIIGSEDFKKSTIFDIQYQLQKDIGKYLFVNYPLQYIDDNGNKAKVDIANYYFHIVDKENLAKYDTSSSTDTTGTFNIFKNNNEWKIDINIAVSDNFFTEENWNEKANIKSLIKPIVSSLMHELTHYFQNQAKGTKWVNHYNEKSYNKEMGSGEYSLSINEIKAFAANIASDIFAAIDEHKIKNVEEAKNLLKTTEGVKKLSTISNNLKSYYDSYNTFFIRKIEDLKLERKKVLQKSKTMKNVWASLVNQIIFHLDNKQKQDNKQISNSFIAKFKKLITSMINK